MTTPLDLDALAALAEAATRGPWGVTEHGWITNSSPEANSEVVLDAHGNVPNGWPDSLFIAASRVAIPQLISRLTDAEALNVTLQHQNDALVRDHEHMLAALTALQEELQAKDRALERMQALAKSLGTTLIRFTPDGSEFYIKIGDDYYADAQTCGNEIRRRFDALHEHLNTAIRERKQLERAALAEKETGG